MVALHANKMPATLLDAVRARRIALKMTLREFSKVIGRNMWTISEWENGRAVPRLSSRERLVQWLGHDPDAKRTRKRKTGTPEGVPAVSKEHDRRDYAAAIRSIG